MVVVVYWFNFWHVLTSKLPLSACSDSESWSLFIWNVGSLTSCHLTHHQKKWPWMYSKSASLSKFKLQFEGPAMTQKNDSNRYIGSYRPICKYDAILTYAYQGKIPRIHWRIKKNSFGFKKRNIFGFLKHFCRFF